jgi:hypothetical protein
MNTLPRWIVLLALSLTSLRAADQPAKPTSAANDKLVAAVAAADEERIAATKAGDRARLDAIFSNELRYVHSSGKVDSKTSYIESLATHSTVYESFDYKERNFVPAGPGIVLMNGRVFIKASNNGQKVENDLNFLSVWREENGRWRFLAWQSSKNPPAAPATK